MKKNKIKQARCCSVCGKNGHNKSTCPNKNIVQTSSQSPVPNREKVVKFFIHHTDINIPSTSSHTLNLKQSEDFSWDKVETEQSYTKQNLYHLYHKNAKQYKAPVKLMAEINNINFAEIKTLPEPVKKTLKQTPIKKQREKKYLIKKSIVKIKQAEINFYKRVENFTNRLNFKKLTAVTALFALFLIVPMQANSHYYQLKLVANKVESEGTNGFTQLQKATLDLLNSDIENAQKSIDNAIYNFEQAKNTMDNNYVWLQKITKIIPFASGQLTSRENIILAGQSLSKANKELLTIVNNINNQGKDSLGQTINIISDNLKNANYYYGDALEKIASVDESVLPFEYQNFFKEFKVILASLVNDLQNIEQLSSSLKEIFGAEGYRRYLLAFQNPNELRPTGGFLGSYAVIDIKDGKIQNLEVPPAGSYDMRGYNTAFVEPPAPLLLLNKRWEFQDSNWFPNFPDSAQKMMWFYQKSKEKTVDGVIAINSNVLEKLLTVLGPIKNDQRDLVLSSENALQQIRGNIEENKYKSRQQKQIISDLAKDFVKNIENIKTDQVLPLLLNLHESLEEKDIQLYFTDNEVQKQIEDFGWAGKIIDTENKKDYLMVVNSNIQGQKSDAYIEQKISHESLIEPDGTILNTVTIARTHTGTKGEYLYGQTNIDYIRVYTPQNSELISASGFTWPDEKYFRAPESWVEKDFDLEKLVQTVGYDSQSGTNITTEFNKTAFGNWVITEPGQTSKVTFTYKLPFKIATDDQNNLKKWSGFFTASTKLDSYQLVFQKQSGNNTDFESQIILDETYSPVWNKGNNITTANNGFLIDEKDIKKDQIWSFIIKHK